MGMIINIIGICIGIGVIGSIAYVVRKARRVSAELFGTANLVEGLVKQEEVLEETPKSVAGMTKLMLPQIQADFPEFNWSEWKQRCENQLGAYLDALENQNVSGLVGASTALKEQLTLEIKDEQDQGMKQQFQQFQVHQTEIAHYQHSTGLCRILIQTAYEVVHTIEKRPEVQAKKEQHRCEMELIYVQDVSKVEDAATSYGVHCPNCGAPITKLGSKFCEYCGSVVEPINIRVWELHKIDFQN